MYRGVPQSVSFVVRNTQWVSLWLESQDNQPPLSGIGWEVNETTPTPPQVLQTAPPQYVWEDVQEEVRMTVRVQSVSSASLGPRTLVVESKSRRDGPSVTETATITFVEPPNWYDW